jgi:hypothetical protein
MSCIYQLVHQLDSSVIAAIDSPSFFQGLPAVRAAGSPLSLCPNVTRTRGRRGGGFPLATPAGPHAAQAGSSSMLGSFTIMQKGPAPATGAAAATGRGRGRRAAGAAAAGGQGEGGAEGPAGETAIMITTKGECFLLLCNTRMGYAAVLPVTCTVFKCCECLSPHSP